MNLFLLLSSALLPSLPCATFSTQEDAVESPLPWAAPDLDRAVAVRDGHTGELLSFDALLDNLAAADAVFLGETHIDETTHRVELGVYEGLIARRSGKVVLAMEMFHRDVQDALDAYVAGESSEAEFLASSSPWGNYATGYRPLVELARSHGLTVIGSNFPKSIGRRLSMMPDGADLNLLEPEERALVPKELFANSPAYWRRVDNAVRGHLAMMRIDPGDTERLYSTQSLWDNSMGEACAIALDEHPGSSVLHVNGGFHSAYWDGTVRQFQLRKPSAKVLTVAIVATSNPAVADPSGAPMADYIVYAEARATDINEGTYSVQVSRETEYRLHLPQAAKDGTPVPLLIWLSGDGFTAADGMDLWRSRLGDECAIAVIEAPYRETQSDLMQGGRWFWPDSFASDLGGMQVATERIWGYLLRHYPIDPTRVCIAGEGTGATVVASVSLSTERVAVRAVGFSPRRYTKLKDIPLPLPEFRGEDPSPPKSLRLLVAPQDEEWWSGELAEYAGVGFENTMQVASQDPWWIAVERETALREALGLGAPTQDPAAPRRHIIAGSPRARLWARLLGTQLAREEGVLVAVLETPPTGGDSLVVEAAVSPADYAGDAQIPRCPGPFGGTTVIVLPELAPKDVTDAWLALEADDPIHQKSRFHRLRVAQTGGERDLPTVLKELKAKGRKNVLVIPAAFCADGETMRSLKRSARGAEDQMTLRWRPGLGG